LRNQKAARTDDYVEHTWMFDDAQGHDPSVPLSNATFPHQIGGRRYGSWSHSFGFLDIG
jgi:hypothetical protein